MGKYFGILLMISTMTSVIACNKGYGGFEHHAAYGWGGAPLVVLPKPTLIPKLKQAFIDGKLSVNYHKIVGPSLKPLPYKKGIGWIGKDWVPVGWGWGHHHGIGLGWGHHIGVGKAGLLGKGIGLAKGIGWGKALGLGKWGWGKAVGYGKGWGYGVPVGHVPVPVPVPVGVTNVHHETVNVVGKGVPHGYHHHHAGIGHDVGLHGGVHGGIGLHDGIHGGLHG